METIIAQRHRMTDLRPTLARMTIWTGQARVLEDFYRDLFGFITVIDQVYGEGEAGAAIAKAWGFAEDARVAGIIMRAPRGGVEIGITYVIGASLETRPTIKNSLPGIGTAYIVLYVPDLDAVIAKADAKGTEYNRVPKRLTSPDGTVYYEMALYDPDGTVLLVVQDVKPRSG